MRKDVDRERFVQICQAFSFVTGRVVSVDLLPRDLLPHFVEDMAISQVGVDSVRRSGQEKRLGSAVLG